jgi:VIT1/CCC1 family predicted Fe2+/Mn2+ transporter
LALVPTSRDGGARHQERHFGSREVVRDFVIGMSDGLTVPFALAAGLSGAVQSSSLVVTAGLAEIAAGAISMGLGGYLAGRSEIDHYASERRRERREVAEMPEEERAEVAAVFRRYGLTDVEIAPILARLSAQPDAWVDFMMRFELGLERPSSRRALVGAVTIGGAYATGGFVPLVPYMLAPTLREGLAWSAAVTMVALAAFGHLKARLTGARPARAAAQTVLIGGLAAVAAFAIARLVGG